MSGLQFCSGGHSGDETVVEFFGGVVAAGFELGLKGGDFDEAGEIASGPNGDGDVRNVDAKDLNVFLFHAEAIHVSDFVPGFEGDDEVDFFVLADAFDAEHGGNVDDADATNFHVIAGNLGAG